MRQHFVVAALAATIGLATLAGDRAAAADSDCSPFVTVPEYLHAVPNLPGSPVTTEQSDWLRLWQSWASAARALKTLHSRQRTPLQASPPRSGRLLQGVQTQPQEGSSVARTPRLPVQPERRFIGIADNRRPMCRGRCHAGG
jgi:hypothetical protein